MEAEYRYDPSGYRVQKEVDGELTQYLWEGGRVAAQKTGTGANIWYYYDSGGTRAAMEYGGQMYYYYYNLQGDVPPENIVAMFKAGRAWQGK